MELGKAHRFQLLALLLVPVLGLAPSPARWRPEPRAQSRKIVRRSGKTDAEGEMKIAQSCRGAPTCRGAIGAALRGRPQRCKVPKNTVPARPKVEARHIWKGLSVIAYPVLGTQKG